MPKFKITAEQKENPITIDLEATDLSEAVKAAKKEAKRIFSESFTITEVTEVKEGS